MIKMRRGKSHQVMNEGQVRGYLCKSAFIALFSPHFPLDLGGLKKWVREGKLSPLFLSLLFSFANQIVENNIFQLIFLFLFFILPVFTPTKHTLSFEETK